ncbi:hypothetical protein KS4_26760 [Poriferisphaera corsica]|uniref:Methyltransferase domain-containing protein n=1 Tax=Poriferisphaera corsica TaxID=2528020 RepID=A0A517YWK2_9BACT|nr:methyltransferase domain-containing protein [Poriferisphaera corsica]QDU34605.1 hypothetical protein KS4_26760 [Poriferisphaera corsica]
MRDEYLKPYRKAAQQCGSDFGVTLWANEKTQRLRFQVFTEMCYMAGKRVLDAGCSRGDLAAYLIERELHYAHYTGIDGIEDVIQFAQNRKLGNTTFIAGDFVADGSLFKQNDPQVITISGTLNTMSDKEALRVLDAAWNATSQTLLFNFLSDRVSKDAPKQGWPARRLPALKLLDWALSETPLVSYRQDYFPNGHDATIMMAKQQPQ